ncbi:DEAD/DEAH box helicase [Chloroflexota bacterium]
MNPIQITEQLRETIIRYLLTTFDVNRDGKEPALHAALRESFSADGALFNGPFLELTLPYLSGANLNELAKQGVIENDLLQLDCFKKGKPIWPDTPLYLHQESAIRKLCSENHNIIVSSGTGSGKTECFLIPILNDLLKDPSPGVRAVIIYPLNALVNDQLERLRDLLAGTEITFGRYTGELPQSKKVALRTFDKSPLPNEVICRDEIQLEGKIPQILITNYAMLEYLLLRPADAPLFNSGAWRFIVLDEAHTHAGAQGIEVGLLIRRLRHRLRLATEDTRCIATSATLTDDRADDAATFASALFGVPFSTDDVIFGQIKRENTVFDPNIHIRPETYLHSKMGKLIEAIRNPSPSTLEIAILMEEIGLINSDAFDIVDEYENKPKAFLWQTLGSNPDLLSLREFMANHGDPIAVEKASSEVFGDRLPADDREQALFHLIELGSVAREDEDSPPLLPAKYHLFARPPQGIWVCINASCSGRQGTEKTRWSRVFATRRQKCDSCGKSVYPIYVCRTCGKTYIRGVRDRVRILAEADPVLDTEPQYFSWSQIFEDPSLADDELEEGEEIDITKADTSKFTQTEFALCLNCQKPVPTCVCKDSEISHVVLYRIDEIESNKKGTRKIPVSHLNECPRCRDKALGQTEIATPVSLYSTTPLSILTNELYRLIPKSSDKEIAKKPGGGRKLLSFYDSRQGAARFAAFLQDTVNDQVYRHIIPEAAKQLEHEKGRLPDLDEVADRCFKIAWDYRIFHNDPDFSDDLRRTRRPSGAQRDRLRLKFLEQAIAEFTTRRRRRQSLESLGLIAIEYFEPGDEPNFKLLAEKIGLEETKTRTFVEYLLDGLRNQKIVVLPDGVRRDSEVFGRNKFNYRLVRSKAQSYEAPWIGETERQHRRQFVKQVFQEEGLPNGEEAQKEVLNAVFDWLWDETDLLDGSASEGYHLAYDRIFLSTEGKWYQCEQCRRFSPRGTGGLVCPHHNCKGKLSLIEIDTSLDDNFYRHIFSRELIPMRVEEHTAQLESEKGRLYQQEFKKGNINVLSCSTTFEMGIDLGDLQGIVLSNVPPTVANYKQRAGRAGRRTSGTAFILSWASDRPHDQAYFTAPTGIINGQVRVPHLATQNEFILQRHVNAILFSAFMRYRKSEGYDALMRVGPFFDSQVVSQPHYDGMEIWFETRKEDINKLLNTFVNYLDGRQYNMDYWKSSFINTFRTKGRLHYSEVTEYYSAEVQSASTQISKEAYSDELADTVRRYGKLLERFRGNYLINFLSDRGILPSYSFPLHTVELMIHPDKARGLRLQRDVRQAIREYAPGQEIVADKRIWKSIGLTFYRETPQLFHYRICEKCNHLQVGKEAGIPIAGANEPCPLCNETPSNKKKNIYRYLEPDGFRTGKDSGIPARQYVNREPNLMRSALIPIEPDDTKSFGEILEAGYSREGKLLYVNEGRLGLGFKICQKCGTRVMGNRIKCPGKYRGEPCTGQLEFVSLGFQEVTDTLRLTFHPTPTFSVPDQYDKSFWISLMYALIQGASQALQIERRDIDGVLFPKQMGDGTWIQTIVLYDDVPGGAGHVRQIREEIVKVIREALRIANCVDCALDSSCYHCLRDYSNQYDHHILKRGPVVKFLEGLLASLMSTGDPSQPNPVVALNYPRWLMQAVGRAHHKVVIVADGISLLAPSGEFFHWLDILNHLLRRDVQVLLRLTKPYIVSLDEPETLSVGRYLRLMIDNGLELDRIETVPEWRLLIDPDSVDSARALKPTTASFCLDNLCGEGGLETLTSTSLVSSIAQEIESISGKRIDKREISPPANVQVINIDSSMVKFSEEALFKRQFEQPIIEFQINDRYLYDNYRIVERLGRYIQMASKGGKLGRVIVHTWDAGHSQIRNSSREEQNRAIDRLKSKFPKVSIEFKRTRHVEHDRFIVLKRDNGTHARILFGKGLDYINQDGTVERTYIVVEDPYQR